jgi:hypothetical protein
VVHDHLPALSKAAICARGHTDDPDRQPQAHAGGRGEPVRAAWDRCLAIVTRAIRAAGGVLARLLFRRAANRMTARRSGQPCWPGSRRSADRRRTPSPGPD